MFAQLREAVVGEVARLTDVERTWNIYASQGQILALTFRSILKTPFKLFFIHLEAISC